MTEKHEITVFDMFSVLGAPLTVSIEEENGDMVTVKVWNGKPTAKGWAESEPLPLDVFKSSEQGLITVPRTELSNPRTMNPMEVKIAADCVLEDYLTVLERAGSCGPLSRMTSFRFDVDGLPEEMSCSGNLYAALCANLHGAQELDWGWGWYEIVNTTADHGLYIEHNDLNYVSEIFGFLNHEFSSTIPDFTQHIPGTPLFELLRRQVAGEIHWNLRAEKGLNDDTVPDYLTIDALGEHLDEHVKALIDAINQ